MRKCAGVRKAVSKAFSMAELRPSISNYLRELERRGASKHTIRNYGADLEQFAQYFEIPDAKSAPPVEQLDLALLREWLSDLYDRSLTPVTIRRKLAADSGVLQVSARRGYLSGQHRCPASHAEGEATIAGGDEC